MSDTIRATGARFPRQTLAFTALALIAFAANSLLCRAALAHTAIDPATFTVVRILSGAMVLAILAAGAGSRAVGGSWPGAAALLGYAAFFSFAYVSVGAATGALLLFGAVQATMIISGLIAGERPGALQWSGLVCIVGGLLALLLPGATAPDVTGAGLMILAGIAWGAYSLLGRSTPSPGQGPLVTTAGNFARAVPLALPLLTLAASRIDAQGLLYAVLSGALASGVGYALWYAALPSLSATRAAALQSSVPVITAMGGVLILGETVTSRLVVASLAVLGGIAMVIGGRASQR